MRGPQVRLPFDGTAHARWLGEVLDGLELAQTDLLAVSWGGYVGLQTALVAPERLRRLALLVPAGIVSGSAWQGLTRVGIPMLLYRLSPSETRLRRFVSPLFTTWDDDWAHYMGDAMRDFVLDIRIPPLVQPAALQNYTLPTLVMAASDDISFPGDKLLARVRELIPHAQTELIPNCRHAPPATDEFRQWLAERITAFLH